MHLMLKCPIYTHTLLILILPSYPNPLTTADGPAENPPNIILITLVTLTTLTTLTIVQCCWLLGVLLYDSYIEFKWATRQSKRSRPHSRTNSCRPTNSSTPEARVRLRPFRVHRRQLPDRRHEIFGLWNRQTPSRTNDLVPRLGQQGSHFQGRLSEVHDRKASNILTI